MFKKIVEYKILLSFYALLILIIAILVGFHYINFIYIDDISYRQFDIQYKITNSLENQNATILQNQKYFFRKMEVFHLKYLESIWQIYINQKMILDRIELKKFDPQPSQDMNERYLIISDI